jgi:hypothetical protein
MTVPTAAPRAANRAILPDKELVGFDSGYMGDLADRIH